jgi:hypothetical protein
VCAVGGVRHPQHTNLLHNSLQIQIFVEEYCVGSDLKHVKRPQSKTLSTFVMLLIRHAKQTCSKSCSPHRHYRIR